MNPAQAMGTFLRVWREEWAGLSREQVAIAASALAPKAKVTKYVVREWEQGQPPHSTAELEALLTVMQRHGITEWEAQDFRRAVLAACSARQYPELFPDESIAYREDVEGVAFGLMDREVPGGRSNDVVSLVASLKEMEEAVLGDDAPEVGRGQARSQQVALVYLRWAVKIRHWDNAARHLQVVRCTRANGDFLQAYFGPRGLGGWLSVNSQRVIEAMSHFGAGLAPDARHHARLMFGLYEQSWASGDYAAAMDALYGATNGAACLPLEEACRMLLEAEGHLEAALRTGWEMLPALRNMLHCAVGLGLRTRAEAYLTAAADCEEKGMHADAWRLMMQADWAQATGRLGEAEALWQRLLDLASAAGHGAFAAEARDNLEQCERVAHPSRTISIAR